MADTARRDPDQDLASARLGIPQFLDDEGPASVADDGSLHNTGVLGDIAPIIPKRSAFAYGSTIQLVCRIT